jgi:hypothetical protein
MAQQTRHGLYGGPRAAYGSFAGKIESVTLVQPSDDDTDTTVTARTDRDGYTVRAPRVTLLHAVDSALNVDLVGADRTAMDRYSVRSRRNGRTPAHSETSVVRLKAFSLRAADAFAPRTVIVRYTESSKPGRRQTDTTDRTDIDGYTLRVPPWQVSQSSDSARNADLSSIGVTDRDRFKVRLRVPRTAQRGFVHRIKLGTDGRAGNAGIPKQVNLTLTLAGRRLLKAKAT